MRTFFGFPIAAVSITPSVAAQLGSGLGAGLKNVWIGRAPAEQVKRFGGFAGYRGGAHQIVG